MPRYQFVIKDLRDGRVSDNTFCMETVVIRKPSGSTGLASRRARELDRLDDRELLRIFSSRPTSSPLRVAACEILVSRHQALVRACVFRYRHSPEPTDDLLQVGYVGLMKAINNFDAAVGENLAAYAQRCVTGEIKRHFRDKRWHAHVERPVQGLVLALRSATAELIQELGRNPTDAEVAARLAITGDEVRTARKAELALRPVSLDAPIIGELGAGCLAETLGSEDAQLELMLDWSSVVAHWGDLASRDQRILLMRYFGGMTQAQIGERLGISQMQVSRLIAAALARLRRCLLDSDYPARR